MTPAELYKTLVPDLAMMHVCCLDSGPTMSTSTTVCPIAQSGLLHQPFTGSYGSLPLPVRAICDELTDEVESSPDRFLRVDYIGYMTMFGNALLSSSGHKLTSASW